MRQKRYSRNVLQKDLNCDVIFHAKFYHWVSRLYAILWLLHWITFSKLSLVYWKVKTNLKTFSNSTNPKVNQVSISPTCLHAAFACADPESIQRPGNAAKTDDLTVIFTHLGFGGINAARKNVDEIETSCSNMALESKILIWLKRHCNMFKNVIKLPQIKLETLYRAFHRFGQSICNCADLVLGTNQLTHLASRVFEPLL